MAALATGQILRTLVTSDKVDTEKYGDADLVDVSATYDEEAGTVAFFLANRGLDEAADVEVALRGFSGGRVTRAEVLAVPEGGDRFSSNTEGAQDTVGLVPLTGVTVDGGTARLRLPALSWAVVELEVGKA
jgi:alpha-N-arabinofuranosidase